MKNNLKPVRDLSDSGIDIQKIHIFWYAFTLDDL